MNAFPSDIIAHRGLALMNLDLHGCIGVTAANLLCDCKLISPVTFVKPHDNIGNLAFEAVEMDLAAIIEIGRISQAAAADHPFITEAFARMRVDQFATEHVVVFDSGYLSRCSTQMLEIAFRRSARGWRCESASDGQG